MNPRLHIMRFLILSAFAVLLFFSVFPSFAGSTLQAQETRKVKSKIDPEYPELARRLNLKGIVRVQVTIAAAGTVKNVKELGGNPVLLDALVKAVKKWKYEPADRDSVLEVVFDFTGTS